MNKESNNLIETLLDLRKEKESTRITYKKEINEFNRFDYSYFYKDNEKYVISIIYPFFKYLKGIKFPYEFKESINKEYLYDGDNFDIIKSKFKYNDYEFDILNLVIDDTSSVMKDLSFNSMLCIVNEFIDMDNRKVLFDSNSKGRNLLINRWLKYIRNNDDNEIVPCVIAHLYFLNLLYQKDKSTRLKVNQKRLEIEYKGKILIGCYPYEYPIFSLRLDSRNKLLLGMKLDKNGKSINYLLNKDLVNTLDKEAFKEVNEIIYGMFGNEYLDELDIKIPYQIKLNINECKFNEEEEDLDLEDEFSKKEIEEIIEASKDEGEEMTIEEFRKICGDK